MSFTNYITSQIKREIKLIGVSDSVALCKLTPAKDLFNVTFFTPETLYVRLELKEITNHFTKPQSE